MASAARKLQELPELEETRPSVYEEDTGKPEFVICFVVIAVSGIFMGLLLGWCIWA